MNLDPSKTARSGAFQMLAGATLISFSPVFVQLADVGPTIAGFYRCLFGGLFLLAIALKQRQAFWAGTKPLMLALVAAAAFTADLSFWHRSIAYIGPGLSTIMANLQVFFLAAFGILVFKERAGWRFLVSVPLAVGGLFMLVGIDWNALSPDYRLGVYFGLITALAYSIYVLVLRESQSLPDKLPPSANLAVISLAVAGFMAIEGQLQGEVFQIPNVVSWLSMLGYGILSHAMGWILISRGLVTLEASRAGLFLLLQPTLAFVWDVLFFGRPTTLFHGIGATLALTAIYLGGNRERT